MNDTAETKKMDVLAVVPLEDHPLSPDDAGEEFFTNWIAGDIKPHHEGPYLRQFDEGEALSWWYENRWNMDSFFAGASDIQHAPWRGFDLAALAGVGGAA